MKREMGSTAVASTRGKQPARGAATERDRLSLAVCSRCSAVHRDKRWALEPQLHQRLLSEAEVRRAVCPACLMQQNGLIEGIVKVQAAWTAAQMQQAVNLARHEEEREAEKNALHRIVTLDAREDGLEISTTTEFLARHLARRLEKTFAGQRVIKQAPGEKFVEILVTA